MSVQSITPELEAILSAVYGEEVRTAIHDAIEKTYNIVEATDTATTVCYRPTSVADIQNLYDNKTLNVVQSGIYPATTFNTWEDLPEKTEGQGFLIVYQYNDTYVLQQYVDVFGQSFYRVVNINTKEIFESSGAKRISGYDQYGWFTDHSLRFYYSSDPTTQFNSKLTNILDTGVYAVNASDDWEDRPAGVTTGFLIVYQYNNAWVQQQYHSLYGEVFYRIVDRIESTFGGTTYYPGDILVNPYYYADSNGWSRIRSDVPGVNASWISGRRIAILGDSISSYAGYLPSDYAAYYPRTDIDDVRYVTDTWWYQLINSSGAQLSANLSYSGSGVCKYSQTEYAAFPSLYERVDNYTLNDPDIIFICLGTNDITKGVSLGTDVSICVREDMSDLSESYFTSAYVKGMKLLKSKYPNAEIVIINGVGNLGASSHRDFYNAVAEIADYYNCKMFDCSSYTRVLGVHPGAKGMYEIARTILNYNERYESEISALKSRIAALEARL